MRVVIDGNEAAVDAAYRLSELCAIYPITPSSPMAERADEWSSHHRTNVWGSVPVVVEMQSEGGAAGAMHGALQGGALATTFTASQGLLLMIPDMYKIAGELTSTVFHVAARTVATQALSIFGDHSDVMAVRQTGFALLSSASVQEAHDMAVVAHAATLRTRVPFLHFFDGFRTSHELNTVELVDDDTLRTLVPEKLVREHRMRALSPERPSVRGTAQNPDVAFQARETVNPFHARTPGVVQSVMDELATRTGRGYQVVEYAGHASPDAVVVVMGSGAQTVRETVTRLVAEGVRCGVLQVRLYRPFPTAELLAALPAGVRRVAVLDRTKEPGSAGEPLFLDVMTTLAEAHQRGDLAVQPLVIGGRYGLSSKELTPAMVRAVVDELSGEHPRPRFTIGITDDVGGTSLPWDASPDLEDPETYSAVFHGIGSDGSVGATKNTAKILGSVPGLQVQAYFVYDSKKSGAPTVSHLRFGPHPVRAPYLVERAAFVACHHLVLLDRVDVLSRAAPGATVLLNAPQPVDEVWDALPRSVQQEVVDKHLRVWAVDADTVAREAGIPGRTNTVLQTCFLALCDALPVGTAVGKVKEAIRVTYAKRGPELVRRNELAVDAALAALHEVAVPGTVTSDRERPSPVPLGAPSFVREVTGPMMAGHGDDLPVSLMPVDGTFPSGTSAYEKRQISDVVATWDPGACIQCGSCSFVCPHAVIRAKYYDESALAGAPEGFPSAPLDAVGLPGTRYSLQVYAEDCTGCGLCVEACPVVVPTPGLPPGRRAINLEPLQPRLQQSRSDIAFFESLPVNRRSRVDFGTVRGTQFLQPLFEFSGACTGCGETPYLKLLTQLFGERATVANATGCSSIYGGNLPTTPWTKNAEGRGPAWSNSLFEDNAEFGLGLRLAADLHLRLARERAGQLRDAIGGELVDAILDAPQQREVDLAAQHGRVAELVRRLDALPPDAGSAVQDLRSVADHLLRRSVWIVGGDGWAYDIDSGGLDHVLASGRDVNVLVLDTESYSNTGGQASKATPLGAVAKFASGGKAVEKKDLALQAIAYGSVYVARVAMGADQHQTLTAFREAEAYPGPSLVIAYSHCITHGIEMRSGLDQQYRAVACGHWPLLRYDPMARTNGTNPFQLDSPRPRIAFADYAYRELRYRVLRDSDPQEADRLMRQAQEAIDRRWETYEEMAARSSAPRQSSGRERPPHRAHRAPTTERQDER